ncbi:MAG TPA: hypothetical protein VF533_25365, partial [Solirubrobacteraceae bacterium]
MGVRPRGATAGRVDALITEGESRTALAGARALGRAGLRPLVLGPRRDAAALWSRFTAARATGPAPGAPGFAERIGALAAAHGPLVVHPGQEDTLDPLSAAMDAL